MECLIIDDQPIIKSGLVQLVRKLSSNVAISESTTIREALTKHKNRKFQLIITDIETELDTILARIANLKAMYPEGRILIYSRVDEEAFAIPMIKAGASGFVSKQAELDEVSNAVRTLLNMRRYLSNRLQSRLIFVGNISSNPAEILSRREMMVMSLMLVGKTNKEIASTLGIKDNTVSTFKYRVYKKFSVSNAVELARKLSFHASVNGSDGLQTSKS